MMIYEIFTVDDETYVFKFKNYTTKNAFSLGSRKHNVPVNGIRTVR